MNLGSCAVCGKITGRLHSALPTAALPEFRAWEAPSFSGAGVDLAGPLYIKDTVECMGVCVALLLCCATIAVHLELVKDLSATAFMCCF